MSPPDSLTTARTCIAAAATADDGETAAYFLASASLTLAELSQQVTETREGLARVRAAALKRWRKTQTGPAKP